MNAHKLAEKLLELPEDTKVFIGGGWSEAYELQISDSGNYKFAEGKTHVVVLNTKAGGEHIDKHYIEHEEV